jgi:hypothetical protein
MVIAPEKTGHHEHKQAEDAIRELHHVGFKMNNHAVWHFSFLVLSVLLLIVKDGAPGLHTPPVERRG